MRLSRDIPLIASLALSLGIHYFWIVAYPRAARRLEFHTAMNDATAPSQYRHRVLIPYVADAMVRAVQIILPDQTNRSDRQGSQKAILGAYLILDTSGIMFGLIGIYLLCREWMEPPWPMMGVLLSAATMPLTFRDALFHPWSQAEFALNAIGLWLAVTGRYRWLALVALAASLNRETSLFLLLGIFFGFWPDRKRLGWALGYLSIWALVFVGLRVFLGFPPPTFTIAKAIRGNLSPERLPWSVVLNTLIFGAWWLCIWKGWRLAPTFLRQASLCVIPYCLLLLVIGYWNEIRYWTAVFPLLIPLALFYVRDMYGGKQEVLPN